MNECMSRIKNGIITENPVFIMALGLCPTFAVTTSVGNAIGMGLSSMAVLVFSNLVISAIRNLIPDRVRLPAEIVVVASLVTIVQLLIQGFAPAVYDALGIYIPLIVVNCIILGRAEAYALKAKPIPALFDGIGMGLGFTFALILLGGFREIIGAGAIFFGGGDLLLVIFTRDWKDKLNHAVHDRKAMWCVFGATVFGPFVGVSASLLATQYTSTGIAQTLFALTPILIIAPAAWLFHQRVTLREVIGAAISVCGVCLFFI